MITLGFSYALVFSELDIIWSQAVLVGHKQCLTLFKALYDLHYGLDFDHAAILT